MLPRGEQDYLDTLSLLIQDYDRAYRLATQPADPVTLLRHLMEDVRDVKHWNAARAAVRRRKRKQTLRYSGNGSA